MNQHELLLIPTKVNGSSWRYLSSGHALDGKISLLCIWHSRDMTFAIENARKVSEHLRREERKFSSLSHVPFRSKA